MDDALRQAIEDRLSGGQLPCAQAMAIARTTGLTPAQVGSAADHAGIRISHCQLGLFGYGPKSEGKHKIVQPLPAISQEVAGHLRAAAPTGGIPCAALWKLAEDLGLSRLEAAGAAEALGLHVSHCQLGCFPRPKPERAGTAIP